MIEFGRIGRRSVVFTFAFACALNVGAAGIKDIDIETVSKKYSTSNILDNYVGKYQCHRYYFKVSRTGTYRFYVEENSATIWQQITGLCPNIAKVVGGKMNSMTSMDLKFSQCACGSSRSTQLQCELGTQYVYEVRGSEDTQAYPYKIMIIPTESSEEDASTFVRTLTVTPSNFVGALGGGKTEISIKCNAEWKATADVDWISLSTAGGYESAKIVVTYGENEGNPEKVGSTSIPTRQGKVTITSGSLTRTLTVSQAGKTGDSVVQPKVYDKTSGARIESYRVEYVTSGSGSPTKVDYNRDVIYVLPATIQPPNGALFAGWRCSNGRRYDDGMLIFNLGAAGETVTMTAIWE